MAASSAPPAAPLVVLDTNVLLSALVFASGRLARLRRAWQDGRCVPLASTATATELVRVLGYPKFRLDAAEREDLLADFLPWCRRVRIPARLPALPSCRDPDDQMFVELAWAGKADFLVTGDKDLLALAPAFARAIVTPDAFLDRLG
jgi:putative PIN family toxin of toxin-antitoxin system